MSSKAQATSWESIERESGLSRADLAQASQVCVTAKRVIGVYGICPVRGHSNVQVQRTVGISEKPEPNPLIALSHHDQASRTPASKAVPVRILA